MQKLRAARSAEKEGKRMTDRERAQQVVGSPPFLDYIPTCREEVVNAITAALADQREADARICDLEAEQRRARAAGAQERGNLHVAEEYKLLADQSAMLAERIRGGGKE